ncbi:MAG: histidine kinase [Rubrivivax sp.]|nr:histidine kinase [Rubrivivax sp.]
MHIDRALLLASWQSWVSNDDRPRAGPYWLQWLWTLLFSLVLAVGFTLLGFLAFGSGRGAWRNLDGWIEWYGRNLVVCLTIGALIHLLFDLGRKFLATTTRLRRWQPWQRSAYFTGVPLLGVALGWPVGIWLAGADIRVWLQRPEGSNIIVGTLLVGGMMTLLFHHFFASKARQINAERRATEAQLRLLQAQIEPHFLFNTLANVQSLMDHDLPKAKRMLESFTDYLRASLGSLRNESSPLDSELDLARNYLQLLQARMEDRLRFEITADDKARAVPLPPLLLQPLVENAVVHGLEPSIDGGTVRVSAHLDGEQLVLEVRDDGAGPATPSRRSGRPGTGLALTNIRERLLARYGSAASLEVSATHPGTLARITLPLPTP